MSIFLYDSLASLPPVLGGHILVFTGKSPIRSKKNATTVTEVTCRYSIGDQFIIFKRNADDSSQRFEDALAWAVERAEVFSIDSIYAVFELSRQIDSRFLDNISAGNIVDYRHEPLANQEKAENCLHYTLAGKRCCKESSRL